jgi:hypothetical protein
MPPSLQTIAEGPAAAPPEPVKQPALQGPRQASSAPGAGATAQRPEALRAAALGHSDAAEAAARRPARPAVAVARRVETEVQLGREPVPAVRRQRAAGERTPGTGHAAPPPPVIHVTIGRVEVRAAPPRPLAAAPAPRPAAPKLSLDEYLRSRRGRAV